MSGQETAKKKHLPKKFLEKKEILEEKEEIIEYRAPYKQIDDHTYLMRGKEKIQRHSERLVIYNNSKVALFWGKCFLCSCVGHSQRYCPLKYCSKCSTYGHSVVTCANPKNNTIRRQLNLTSTVQKFHPSITSKNWREEKRRYHHQRKVFDIKKDTLFARAAVTNNAERNDTITNNAETNDNAETNSKHVDTTSPDDDGGRKDVVWETEKHAPLPLGEPRVVAGGNTEAGGT